MFFTYSHSPEVLFFLEPSIIAFGSSEELVPCRTCGLCRMCLTACGTIKTILWQSIPTSWQTSLKVFGLLQLGAAPGSPTTIQQSKVPSCTVEALPVGKCFTTDFGIKSDTSHLTSRNDFFCARCDRMGCFR